ncbi:hypothetical protein AALO_G00099720 [Alosa alosa]|uniref:Uncharacterized protein n=1 Tax=Alosa alosa TaxID=278164 RepID=A0AAV6GU87_9TELE|nr:hypothetical protein AALO_G00099720 [Alosa alosa]
MSGEHLNQQEHEDQEQIREDRAGQMERMREMLEREWGRGESAITGRFQHQLSGRRQSGMLSETDVLDLHHSFRKVVMWMHHGTSGHGSFEDFDTEEID